MSRFPPRALPNSTLLLACGICCACVTPALAQGTYNWNTGNGTWNTTDANWSGAGSTWVNGTSSNAVFTNPTYTVTLSEAINGGSLAFNTGGAPSGAHGLNLTGSNLSLGSVLAWGGYNPAGGGGGVDSIPQAYDQRLTFQSLTANVSGNMTTRRGMTYLTGASVNVSGTINSTDAWSVFRADNSTVTATGGIDFSTIACQVELYGGTVTTPFVKVGNAAFAGQGGLTLGNGVTLVPTAASSDYIAVYNNGDVNSRAAAGLASGGVNIDTAYAVTVATQLVGGGSFTKSGTGTLTLTQQSNNYTGGSIVNQGTLVLAAGAWTLSSDGGGGGGAVTVGNGATLTADNSVANKLDGLTLNGGTVNAINSSGNSDWGNYFLTGNVTASGSSSLNADTALRASNVDFNVATGGTLNVGGVMHNGASFGSNGGTPATVSKSGAGTMVLSAINTYSGATTVNAGTLVVNGSLGNAAVSVALGATLGGSGGIAGPVNVLGTLSPGNSPGVITLGSLVLGGSSTTLIEINGTGRGVSYDGVNITGTSSSLTYGGLLSFNFASLSPDYVTYHIFDFTGGFSGAFTTVSSTGAYAGTWTDIGGGQFQLLSGAQTLTFTQSTGDVVVVPEPSTLALAAGGIAIAAAAYRRRSSRKSPTA